MVFWRKKSRNNGDTPRERPKTVYGDVDNTRKDNVRQGRRRIGATGKKYATNCLFLDN